MKALTVIARLSILKTIKVRRTRHAGHCWRSKDELISDILLWTPSHGRSKAGRPARTYIQQLSADTGYSLEDLQGAMDDKDGWQERVREIHASSTWWWWWSSVWKSDLFDKTGFLPSCEHDHTIVWMHHMEGNKILEKKIDSNNARMLRAILKKSRKYHFTKQQLWRPLTSHLTNHPS